MIRLSIRQQKSYHYRSAAQRIGNIRAGWTQAAKAEQEERQKAEEKKRESANAYATLRLQQQQLDEVCVRVASLIAHFRIGLQ